MRTGLYILASLVACGPPAEPEVPTAPDVEVHGDWTITVVEPSGEEVSHTEFHNVYLDAGRIVPKILAGEVIPRRWRIVVQDVAGGPCEDNGSPSSCTILMPGHTDVSTTQHFENLSVDSTSGLTLRGSLVATYAGTLTNAYTYLNACAPEVAPSVCAVDTGPAVEASTVTQKAGLAVPLQPGQQALVEVAISFVSGGTP